MAYLPLSTANLPDPVIDPAQDESPEDYFNTVLYTGNATDNHQITGVGFQPDFLWIKQRSGTEWHNVQDVVRGVQEGLFPNDTYQEVTRTNAVKSFDTDGFTLGDNSGSGWNTSGSTYVAWNWKANGTGVSNTDGSITSTVSANTTSGFSICTFTDAGSAGTVGHGLGVKPDLIIQKPRSGTNDWYVFTEVIDGSFDFLNLNTTGAKNNSTLSAPTSTVFSNLQISGDTVAYCFHSVEGFSKFGSYVGNGSADGPFVYTGFRPAFLLIKNASASFNWIMTDSIRNTSNIDANWKWLYPHLSVAENSPSVFVDYTSNGFKLRSSGADVNGSGNTIIYMAFAEMPTKFSLAR